MSAITVMCFGTFDGLHPGHEDYFRQAHEQGDKVVVIVARDSTVVDVKGDLPSTNETDRLQVIQEHPLVDEAMLGNLDDKFRIIEEIQPDIICLGYDQESFTDMLDVELTRRGLAISIIRCHPYFPDTYKSSLLRGARVTDADFAEETEEEGIPL
ncbi:adenylyltransferase/cytidyltransferase family protein [Patescibacteria group bacterium]|nr:adenylyltransferase/cytidyltransferase family protein [Patescibacteria group bacterium]